ncbi:MAG: ABC transporter permease [Lachnospiraceae bacterium]|nr:ABC transporter permease [Lachnospiraceae bacterium]
MRSAKTIFIKQAKDTMKNPSSLIQFILFPVVAWLMTEFVAKSENFEGMPVNMFVVLMGAVFAGMGLIMVTAGIVAEDIEKKSLRFLVMAGVKPNQYLGGTGSFLLVLGSITALLFGLIGIFTTAELVKFVVVLIACVANSIILGATVGLMSKNQQSAMSLGMPVAVVLAFTPMVANFNETIYNASSFLYTQQLNIITNDFTEDFTKAMIVIFINMVVLIVLFSLAYWKRGLRS